MDNEKFENSVDNEVNTDKDNSSFSSIMIDDDIDGESVVSSTSSSSVVSYKSDKKERRRIIGYSIFIVILFTLMVAVIYHLQYLDTKRIRIVDTSEFEAKLKAIEDENSMDIEDTNTNIKYVLNGKEHIISFKFNKKIDALGQYYYLSYDAKIFVDGIKSQNLSYNFNGTIEAYYGELITGYDGTYLESFEDVSVDNIDAVDFIDKDVVDTYVYYDKVLIDKNNNEYYALLFKSCLKDAIYSYLFILDENNHLVYYLKEYGPYYFDEEKDENLYGGNGYVKFNDDSLSIIEKNNKNYIEKVITPNNGKVSISEGKNIDVIK